MIKRVILFPSMMLIFLAFFIPGCQSSRNTSGKTLKFNYQKGKGYDYEMVFDMQQDMMGKQNIIGMTSGYSIQLISDDPDAKTFKAEFNEFQVHANLMGIQQIDIDSKQPYTDTTTGDFSDVNKMMNRLFRSLEGKPFTMKVSPEGHVLEVNGFEKIFQDMLNSMNMPEEMKEKMQMAGKGQFNEDNIKDQFERIFFIFPGKEVKVGDTWDKSYKLGGTLPGQYQSTYTVKQIDGNFMTVAVDTKIKTENANLDMHGSQQGSMLIDTRTGLVVNSELLIDMKAEVGGMSMAMKGKTRVKGKERN